MRLVDMDAMTPIPSMGRSEVPSVRLTDSTMEPMNLSMAVEAQSDKVGSEPLESETTVGPVVR